MARTILPVHFGNVRLAVLCSFLFHGALILSARYRLSYDAYNHLFFGDHYRMDWWLLWDARWYTGFYVNSYPPLVHQLKISTFPLGAACALGVSLLCAQPPIALASQATRRA